MSDSSTPTLPDPAALRWEWTVECLRRLDWKRWQALAVAVLERNGYSVTPERVRPDGTRLFSLSRGADAPTDSILLLSGALTAELGTTELNLLREEMEGEAVAHGVLATVWPVSPAIAAQAMASRIMVIDGDGFLANVRERTAPDLADLAILATDGDWTTPSCPICGRKMKPSNDSEGQGLSAHPDLTFAGSETVSHRVRASTINVLPGAAVAFAAPVVASKLIVGGIIEGDFLIDGAVIVEPDSILRGRVTARSIDAREGAELDGEASIVSAAALRGMMPPEPANLWICQGYPQCRGIVPMHLSVT